MITFSLLREAESVFAAGETQPQVPVLMEPDPGMDQQQAMMAAQANAAQGQAQQDIYSLYPDLANIDVSDPSTLADYFSSVAEMQKQQPQQQGADAALQQAAQDQQQPAQDQQQAAPTQGEFVS